MYSLERKTRLDLKVVWRVMDLILPPVVSFEAITKITFQLSNKTLFDLFGIEVDPVFRLNSTKASASQLLSISTLQDVHVSFDSPHRGARTSPWGRLDHKIRLDRYNGAYYVCCQRVVVDWICTFAYPIFSQMTGVVVHLEGAIKADTKNELLEKFNSGRPHNQDAALQKIFSTEDCDL